jgi:hypothetical protein
VTIQEAIHDRDQWRQEAFKYRDESARIRERLTTLESLVKLAGDFVQMKERVK